MRSGDANSTCYFSFYYSIGLQLVDNQDGGDENEDDIDEKWRLVLILCISVLTK